MLLMMGAPDDPVDRAILDLDESWAEEIKPKPRAAVEQPIGIAHPEGNDRTILGIGTPQPSPVAHALADARAVDEPSPAPPSVPSAPSAPAPSASPASTAPAASPSSSQRANPLALLQRRRRPTSMQPGQPLAHPEQSPLSFVLRASEPSLSTNKEQSHDMSMFVAGLMADSSPVVDTPPAGTAMEPVMRRSRKRRQWLIASAIAATAALGAVVGIHFAGGDKAPKVAAAETPTAVETAPATVEPPAPAVTEAPAAPTEVAAAPTVPPPADHVAAAEPAPTETVPAETAPAPTAEMKLASAEPTKPIAKTTTKAAPTKKTSTTTTKKATKKVASKTPAKSTTAKKSTSKTAAKTSSKKPAPKKVATAKKTTTKKAPAKKGAARKTR